VGISGISSSFPLLSRSSGQVAHVFRTRSPLGLHRCCHRMDPVRLACVRHAASVRPEPGSNSPSRSRSAGEKPPAGFDQESRLRSYGRSLPTGTRNGLLSVQMQLTTTTEDARGAVGRPHWLLAVPSPLSRSDAGTHFLAEGGATALCRVRPPCGQRPTPFPWRETSPGGVPEQFSVLSGFLSYHHGLCCQPDSEPSPAPGRKPRSGHS
jgi:hypothetical protein